MARPIFGSKLPAISPRPFDANDLGSLETEISEMVRAYPATRERGPQEFAPVQLPNYVEHAEGIDAVGKITAEAVVTQYEELAKTIEQMRDPLRRWIDEYDKAITELKAEIASLDDKAKTIREQAAGAFERLQKSSLAIAEVRKVCGDITRKIEPAA